MESSVKKMMIVLVLVLVLVVYGNRGRSICLYPYKLVLRVTWKPPVLPVTPPRSTLTYTLLHVRYPSLHVYIQYSTIDAIQVDL